MKHFYYYMGLACLLGCPLQLSAQETEKAEAPRTHEVNVKLDKTPDGFANHYSAFYYYNGKEILNMRNYLMKTADKVTSLYINPAGGSYALHGDGVPPARKGLADRQGGDDETI